MFQAFGRQGMRKKYSPGAPQHPPHEAKPSPGFLKNNIFYNSPRNLIFAVAPISLALDLAIYSVYKFWDPSRLRRNAL